MIKKNGYLKTCLLNFDCHVESKFVNKYNQISKEQRKKQKLGTHLISFYFKRAVPKKFFGNLKIVFNFGARVFEI